jgi:hypothetical protein
MAVGDERPEKVRGVEVVDVIGERELCHPGRDDVRSLSRFQRTGKTSGREVKAAPSTARKAASTSSPSRSSRSGRSGITP